jgi:hypothetical protein
LDGYDPEEIFSFREVSSETAVPLSARTSKR